MFLPEYRGVNFPSNLFQLRDIAVKTRERWHVRRTQIINVTSCDIKDCLPCETHVFSFFLSRWMLQISVKMSRKILGEHAERSKNKISLNNGAQTIPFPIHLQFTIKCDEERVKSWRETPTLSMSQPQLRLLTPHKRINLFCVKKGRFPVKYTITKNFHKIPIEG